MQRLDEEKQFLESALDSLGFVATIRAAPEIDPGLIILSGVSGSAELWVMVSEDGTELRIDGDVPGLELSEKLAESATGKQFIQDVLSGKVDRLTLPFYSRIRVGNGKTAWQGVDVDLRLRLGSKKYRPYTKK